MTAHGRRRHRHHTRRHVLRRHGHFSRLGPGLVTGAADDDPSRIGTYSQVGAAFGTGLLWSTIAVAPIEEEVHEGTDSSDVSRGAHATCSQPNAGYAIFEVRNSRI